MSAEESRESGAAGLGDHLHMKGLTVLWMCLCCLRPEDVANVFPQSGQAWARAPTCWERMCRWRLLGSVNTWGDRHLCSLPCGPSSGRRVGGRGAGLTAALPPAPSGGRGGDAPGTRSESVADPKRSDDALVGGGQEPALESAGSGLPAPPPAALPPSPVNREPQRASGVLFAPSVRTRVGGTGGGGGSVTFTQFSHSKRLPLSWDIWWRMRLDFQLKALGHWSHLYSRSSVCTTMCCSRLHADRGLGSPGGLPAAPPGRGPSRPHRPPPRDGSESAARLSAPSLAGPAGRRAETALPHPTGRKRCPDRAQALVQTSPLGGRRQGGTLAHSSSLPLGVTLTLRLTSDKGRRSRQHRREPQSGGEARETQGHARPTRLAHTEGAGRG